MDPELGEQGRVLVADVDAQRGRPARGENRGGRRRAEDDVQCMGRAGIEVDGDRRVGADQRGEVSPVAADAAVPLTTACGARLGSSAPRSSSNASWPSERFTSSAFPEPVNVAPVALRA